MKHHVYRNTTFVPAANRIQHKVARSATSKGLNSHCKVLKLTHHLVNNSLVSRSGFSHRICLHFCLVFIVASELF